MYDYEKADIASLVELIRSGDDSAFSEIAERYSPMLRKLVFRFASSDFVAEEMLNEALVALHRAALTYDVGQVDVSFGLYSRICAYNRLVDYSASIKSRESSSVDVDVESIAAPSSIHSRLEREETVGMLKSCADEVLSEYEHKVFSLCLSGYKTSEIADILGKSAKSVDNAKARMLKRMRERLDSMSEL